MQQMVNHVHTLGIVPYVDGLVQDKHNSSTY